MDTAWGALLEFALELTGAAEGFYWPGYVSVLNCIVHLYTVLYCAKIYCTVLTVLYDTVLHYTTLAATLRQRTLSSATGVLW